MWDDLLKQDIKAIRSFMAIVECKGLSAAQARLHLSQSVISTHLKHLEDTLGVVLCHRGRSGFELTEAGQEVYDICVELTEATLHLRQRLDNVRRYGSHAGGSLRLALADQLPERFNTALEAAIRDCYRQYPGFHLSIRMQSPEVMAQSLATDECDLGVGFFTKALPMLCYHDAISETQCLCCGQRHPLFDQPDPPLAELENHHAWVRRGYMPNRFTAQFLYPQHMTATAYHMEATARFILAGTHLGFLPQDHIKPYLAAGQMRVLLPDQTRYQVTHQWVYKAQTTPLVHQLMQCTQTHLATL